MTASPAARSAVRWSAAASATAPPGSATTLRRRKAWRIASSASRSLTTRPAPASRRSTGKVSSPGVGVTIASQIEPPAAALRSRCPLASERAVSSKRSGSHVRTRSPGAVASSASAIPDERPPPPQHTSTSASATPAAAACSAISRPTVPCPEITCGSSNGLTSVMPRSAAIRPPISSRLSVSRSYSTTSAPYAFVFAILSDGVSSGITMTAGMPNASAAHATPCPWLPLLYAMTPPARSASGIAETALHAPRILNEPVRCRHSALTRTRRPTSSSRNGDESSGVRTTWSRMRDSAARIESIDAASLIVASGRAPRTTRRAPTVAHASENIIAANTRIQSSRARRPRPTTPSQQHAGSRIVTEIHARSTTIFSAPPPPAACAAR